MPSSWPSSLPQRLLASQYSEQRKSSTIRSSVEVGPTKVRRRYTADVIPIKASIVLSLNQVSTLETFFEDTLESGALNFDWVHPRTLLAATFKFVTPPSYNVLGGGWWQASMDLEIIP